MYPELLHGLKPSLPKVKGRFQSKAQKGMVFSQGAFGFKAYFLTCSEQVVGLK